MLQLSTFTAAEKYDGVNLHFNHKLVHCDFDKNEATFEV